MRRITVLFALTLISCSGAESADTAGDSPASPCWSQIFESSRFTACVAPNASVEVHSAPSKAPPYRSFAELEQALERRSSDVFFAMNAGMFDDQGRPIGLLVEHGRELKPINRRRGGGNFHLLPNGVFLVRRDGRAEVVATSDYRGGSDVAFATQSGPMLLLAGKLHPRFDPDGDSRHYRNGVGIAPDGTPVFVISEEPVSFGKLARFYRDRIGARQALYFDGAVSSLWDPRNGRRDNHAELGPMVVAFRKR